MIREGGGQACRTETLGHGWYAIAIAIGLMLYYHSIAIVDRFVQRKKEEDRCGNAIKVISIPAVPE